MQFCFGVGDRVLDRGEHDSMPFEQHSCAGHALLLTHLGAIPYAFDRPSVIGRIYSSI